MPGGIEWEKFARIIKILADDNKIAYDRNGVVGWIYNPEFVKKHLSNHGPFICDTR